MAQQLSALQISTTRFDPHDEQVLIHFQAAEEGFTTLVVFGSDGAWLLSLGEVRINAGANTLAWHGRDTDGWPLPDGLYRLELFGFDLARIPAATAVLRTHVEVLNGRLPHERANLALLLRWLPWGDPAPLAEPAPTLGWSLGH